VRSWDGCQHDAEIEAAMSAMTTETVGESADHIRFTRRIPAMPPGEAGAKVRDTGQLTRRPWEPGAFRTREPVVRLTCDEFHALLQDTTAPVVIQERSGWMSRRCRYTTQCHGYQFTTRADEGSLRMPPGATLIFAERVRFR
jgi:hypothetical protein